MPKVAKSKFSESKKAIHPFSRKAAQIARKEHHEAKIVKRKQEAGLKLGVRGERMKWFHDCVISDDKPVYEKSDVLELIERYLHRFDEELEQISIKNAIKGRQGHQHAARNDCIKFTLEKEQREFDVTGFEIPDLCQKANVDYFRKWTGELRFLDNIKTKSITRDALI